MEKDGPNGSVTSVATKRHLDEPEEETRIVKRIGWDCEDEESAVDQVFRNSVVTEKIFEFLTILDLFSCSLVSRTWRLHARAALRKRCLLNIHLDRHSPWDIENLVQLLEKSPAVPFSGLSLTCSYTWPSGYNDGYPYTAEKEWWDRLANILRAKIYRFSALKLDCGDSWDDVAERLVGRVFPNVYDQLETLEWKGQISSASRLLRGYRSLKKLPRLRYFKFSGTSNSPAPDRLAQRIICSAPKLSQLKGFVNPTWLTAGILNYQDVSWVKEFACDLTPETLDATYEFAKRKPKLERLHISPFTSSSESVASWTEESKRIIKEITSLLIRSGSETLNELIIVQNDLEQLIERGSCVPIYKKLQSLTLYASRGYARNDFAMLHMNFSQLFPNLQRVEIHLFETVSLMGHFPTMGACPSVSSLVLENAGAYMGFVVSNFYLLDRLSLKFPNIRHLYIKNLERVGLDSLPENLWRSWPMLETLSLTGLYLSSLKSWDIRLCGLSAEETAGLKSLTADELANYQYAPIGVSISDNTWMKSLRLEILHNQANNLQRINPGELVISRVAAICSLTRIPGFSIELFSVGRFNVEPDCRFRLDHLDGLVSLSSKDTAFPPTDTDT